MFETNKLNITVESFKGSNLYTMDNFFKDPKSIVNLIQTTDVPLWKENETQNNGKFFIDKRHTFTDSNIGKIQNDLISILDVKQRMILPNQLFTNYFRMIDKPFNDYKNNYWWAHKDVGYTFIVYLNEFDCSGTNLYERTDNEPEDDIPEHQDPWRNRSKYNVIKTLDAKYNRMVMFDGFKFHHGMAIDDDKFFGIERMNVVSFFGY
jgi:hypothetical protein